MKWKLKEGLFKKLLLGNRSKIYFILSTLIYMSIVILVVYLSLMNHVRLSLRSEIIKMTESEMIIESYIYSDTFESTTTKEDKTFYASIPSACETLVVSDTNNKEGTLVFSPENTSVSMSDNSSKLTAKDKITRKIISYFSENYIYELKKMPIFQKENTEIQITQNENIVYASVITTIESEQFNGEIQLFRNLSESLKHAVWIHVEWLIDIVNLMLPLWAGLLFFIYRATIYPTKKLNKKLEKALSQPNKDFQFVTKSYKEMEELSSSIYQLLRELNEIKLSYSDYMKEVSHEVKNKLNNIIFTAANHLEEESYYKEDLEIIIHQAQTINSIINGLNDASRIVHLRKCPPQCHTDVKKVFQECIDITRESHPDKIFDMKIQKDFDLYALIGEDMLKLIIHNVIHNAIKYADEGTPIHTSLSNNGYDWININIANCGPAIPLDLGQKIYQKYYRSKSYAKRIAGSGLGLWIVKEILDIYDGRIYSTSDHGVTTFNIVIKTEISK